MVGGHNAHIPTEAKTIFAEAFSVQLMAGRGRGAGRSAGAGLLFVPDRCRLDCLCVYKLQEIK